MSDHPVRVFLVDDQQLVRAGFAMILDATADMAVAGQAADGQEAIDVLLGPGAPVVDVVLMDLRMPRLDGVEATRRLKAGPDPLGGGSHRRSTPTRTPSRHSGPGASGFLLKDAGPTDLLAAIRAAHRGDAVVAPAVTRRLIDAYVLAPPTGPATAPPTATATDPAVAAGRTRGSTAHRPRARGPRRGRSGPQQPGDSLGGSTSPRPR